MFKRKDYRNIVYANYRERPTSPESRGYKPRPISNELGDTLYFGALRDVDRDAPILELGAGEGHFLDYLRRKGFTRMSGVDISEPLVTTARANGLDVKLVNAIEHLSTQNDETLDAIVAIDMIEHLTKTESISLLQHAFRCLRPGGTILLQTVNGQGLFPGQVIYGDVSHISVLNPMSLGHLLTLTGFCEPVFRESVCFGPGKKAFVRRHAWRLIKRAANICRWVEANKRQDIWSENMICHARKPIR